MLHVNIMLGVEALRNAQEFSESRFDDVASVQRAAFGRVIATLQFYIVILGHRMAF